MLSPSLPVNISDHPYVLHALDILGTPLQEKFERISRLAKNLFDVPIAVVSFIDENRHHFKSLLGTEVIETPLHTSFCQHVIPHEEIFNVTDTLMDERFYNSPYVLESPHIRFYAGYPIQLNRHKIGTVSIADHKPRTFSPDQLAWLKDIAALVETEIQNYAILSDKGKLTSDLNQARMASMVDPLTNLWNRQGIYNILKHRMDEYILNGTGFTVAILDIDGFKDINDTYGHDIGDCALKAVAQSLIKGCRETDAIGRWGGEEFLLLINEPNSNIALDIAQRIRTKVESQRITLPSLPTPLGVTVTIGLTGILPGARPTLESLIHQADQALYEGKRRGRNQVVSV